MIRTLLNCAIAACIVLACTVYAIAGTDAIPSNSRPEYVLSPEDTLQIRVPEAEEFSVDKGTYRIDNEGYVNVPLIGRWRAVGMTVGQAETELTQRLKTYYLTPHASVSVAEQHTVPVSVLGAVNNPGLQRLNGPETIVEALSRAGGLRIEAGQTVTLTRRSDNGRIPLPGAKSDSTGQFSVAEFTLSRVLSGERAAENIVLKPHDIVTVSRAPMIYVLGEVAKTGAFVLNENEDISTLKALTMAGGLSRTAAPSSARVLRRMPGATERTDIPVNLANIMKNKESDLPLQSEDILYIPGSLTKKITLRPSRLLSE